MFAFQCVIPIIVVEKRGVKKNGMRGIFERNIVRDTKIMLLEVKRKYC